MAAKHNVPGEIFNIGAGSPISLTELVKLILKITNNGNLNINYTEPRPGDIIHNYADISKAKRALTFEPNYTQEQGLKEYFKWYNNKYRTNLNIN